MAHRRTRVLVVGASGFIGRALAERLVRSGSRVTAVSRKRIRIPGAVMRHGDLRNPTFCRSVTRGMDVIHYAAGMRKNIAHHTAAPFDFFRGNLEPLLCFLDALRKSPPRTLVYVSTTLVGYVGNSDGTDDGYLLGKYASELALRAFARETGWTVHIVRSAAVYGPGDGTDPDALTFIPSMIRKIRTNDRELLVWGTGKRRLQFVYIDDLVANLIAIGRKKRGDVFAIGNNQTATVDQVAKMVMEALGKKLPIRHDTGKPDKPSQIIRFTPPVKPRVDLRSGLRRTVTSSTL
jgi:nucleoside-diphosphate-sugar epimerase